MEIGQQAPEMSPYAGSVGHFGRLGAGGDFCYPSAGMRMEWITAQTVAELSLAMVTL